MGVCYSIRTCAANTSNAFTLQDGALIPVTLANPEMLDILHQYGGFLRVIPTEKALMDLESPDEAIVFDPVLDAGASPETTQTYAFNIKHDRYYYAWPILLPRDSPAIIHLYNIASNPTPTQTSTDGQDANDAAFDTTFNALCCALRTTPPVRLRRESLSESSLQPAEAQHTFRVLTLTPDGVKAGTVTKRDLQAILAAFGGALLLFGSLPVVTHRIKQQHMCVLPHIAGDSASQQLFWCSTRTLDVLDEYQTQSEVVLPDTMSSLSIYHSIVRWDAAGRSTDMNNCFTSDVIRCLKRLQSSAYLRGCQDAPR
jgi:hypothetical protein